MMLIAACDPAGRSLLVSAWGSFIKSSMKRAKCPSGSQSIGYTGSKRHCPGVYGLNILLTFAEDHTSDPLSILYVRNSIGVVTADEGQRVGVPRTEP